jgi:hypothetical protein
LIESGGTRPLAWTNYARAGARGRSWEGASVAKESHRPSVNQGGTAPGCAGRATVLLSYLRARETARRGVRESVGQGVPRHFFESGGYPGPAEASYLRARGGEEASGQMSGAQGLGRPLATRTGGSGSRIGLSSRSTMSVRNVPAGVIVFSCFSLVGARYRRI